MPTYRTDFPIFSLNSHLVYLDSASSSQKPRQVIEAVNRFYKEGYANIHRGLYPLAEEATARYQAARDSVARFIGAQNNEIVFTKSATEAFNLLAHSLPIAQNWQAGENIVLSVLEHHANLVPWQQVAKQYGLEMRFAELTETGEINLEHLDSLIDSKTRVVSLSHCSNVLGTVLPVNEVRLLLHHQGSSALLILDACQSVPHLPLLVSELNCDFLIFSAHKLYSPSGVGVLWGRSSLLQSLPPYQVGGDMIESVSLLESTWQPSPSRFEAGTPNIEGVVGLDAAITYLSAIGMENVALHTAELVLQARDRLTEIPGLSILGEPDPRSGILSFTVAGIHPHDLASLLGEKEVCIRAGHHCAQPLHTILGIPASNRISFGIYSEESDIDALIAGIQSVLADVRHA